MCPFSCQVMSKYNIFCIIFIFITVTIFFCSSETNDERIKEALENKYVGSIKKSVDFNNTHKVITIENKDQVKYFINGNIYNDTYRNKIDQTNNNSNYYKVQYNQDNSIEKVERYFDDKIITTKIINKNTNQNTYTIKHITPKISKIKNNSFIYLSDNNILHKDRKLNSNVVLITEEKPLFYHQYNDNRHKKDENKKLITRFAYVITKNNNKGWILSSNVINKNNDNIYYYHYSYLIKSRSSYILKNYKNAFENYEKENYDETISFLQRIIRQFEGYDNKLPVEIRFNPLYISCQLILGDIYYDKLKNYKARMEIDQLLFSTATEYYRKYLCSTQLVFYKGITEYDKPFDIVLIKKFLSSIDKDTWNGIPVNVFELMKIDVNQLSNRKHRNNIKYLRLGKILDIREYVLIRLANVYERLSKPKQVIEHFSKVITLYRSSSKKCIRGFDIKFVNVAIDLLEEHFINNNGKKKDLLSIYLTCYHTIKSMYDDMRMIFEQTYYLLFKIGNLYENLNEKELAVKYYRLCLDGIKKNNMGYDETISHIEDYIRAVLIRLTA